jgi:hypothetical protein
MYQHHSKRFNKASPKYRRWQQKSAEIIHKNAVKAQQHYDDIRKKAYDKDRTDFHFEVGDLVLLDVGARLIGNKKKLTAAYEGPFEVIAIMSSLKAYIIRKVSDDDDGTKDEQRVNGKFLKPYFKPFEQQWPDLAKPAEILTLRTTQLINDAIHTLNHFHFKTTSELTKNTECRMLSNYIHRKIRILQIGSMEIHRRN